MVPAPKQRGAMARPRVGRAFCGLPWEGMRGCDQPFYEGRSCQALSNGSLSSFWGGKKRYPAYPFLPLLSAF